MNGSSRAIITTTANKKPHVLPSHVIGAKKVKKSYFQNIITLAASPPPQGTVTQSPDRTPLATMATQLSSQLLLPQ
jgi:hypothetical protein